MLNKYIKIFAIQILGISFSISIGNPMWFINEFKKTKGGKHSA